MVGAHRAAVALEDAANTDPPVAVALLELPLRRERAEPEERAARNRRHRAHASADRRLVSDNAIRRQDTHLGRRWPAALAYNAPEEVLHGDKKHLWG